MPSSSYVRSNISQQAISSTFMSHNFPLNRENRYQSTPTESYDGGSRLHAVNPHISDPTVPELSMPNFVTPSILKTTASASSPMGSMDGHGDGTNVVETYVSEDPTTSSGSQQGSALADDEHFIRKSEEKLRKEPDGRMSFVRRVIEYLLCQVYHGYCPRVRELWLRIIEGDDDDDDLWLWVDGDEDWLHEYGWIWVYLHPTDWLSAQSALRRRVTQRRYPPATGRNEKVRSATTKQRAYAIAWLIASSKAVAELFASHGCTPPTLRAPYIASTLGRIVCKNWDVLPSQTGHWTSAVARSKEDGCICSPADCHGVRQWFDMMVWLEDTPPTLVVGDKPCVRCRSLLKSRYEEVAAQFTATSHVSLLDVFYDYYKYEGKVALSLFLGTTARLQVDRMLEPLMKKHGCDVRYFPPINRYPERLRPRVENLLCGSHISGQHHLWTSSNLPNNVFVGANDPWVVVGITFDCDLAGEDADFHDRNWHSCFSIFLRCSLECFDMPVLPLLSSTGLALCHALDRDYSEERLFCQSDYDMDDSHWVKSDQDGRQLRLTTAVVVAATTFLRNKGIDLRSCRRCQLVCMESFAGTLSAVGFDGADSGDRDNALGRGLSSPLEGSLELGMQEPVGMEAFTNVLRSNPTLSRDEIQSRVTGELHRLRQYLDSIGLDILNCLQRSDSGNRPYLRKRTLPRHLPGRSIPSSSMRSKSDKVEEIKDKLLGMLRELNLPYERLPWYTLEKDLKKHGCTLVNWPVRVLRKRGNRGIHDLSAVEVSTLYEAITCPDESRRLCICRCPSTLTVVPVNHASTTASGSKRPIEELDSPGHPSRRIRFRDMTSKVSQQHLSDLQADGASGSQVFRLPAPII